MDNQPKPRGHRFLFWMSWVIILQSAALIGIAVFQLTRADASITFAGAFDAVFFLLLGSLGFFAGLFGLVSKRLKRCRLVGLICLVITAVPLLIHLLAHESFAVYWKNIAIMIVPFFYLIAALIKRSEKPRSQQQPEPASAVTEPAVVAEHPSESDAPKKTDA